jgi:hypothetical protein
MRPALALHRSLIFWAGLLVITFTCWAWWDSCHTCSLVQWKQLSSNSVARGITVHRDIGARHAFDADRVPVHPYPLGWPRGFLPKPLLLRSQTAPDATTTAPDNSLQQLVQLELNRLGPGSWTLYLPYWLILLAILIPWSLLLLCRARWRGKWTSKQPEITNHQSSNHQSKSLEE